MKERAPRSRTLTCSGPETATLASELLRPAAPAGPEEIIDRIIHADFHDVCRFLPRGFADLVILDPPYDLTKSFNGLVFHAKECDPSRLDRFPSAQRRKNRRDTLGQHRLARPGRTDH